MVRQASKTIWVIRWMKRWGVDTKTLVNLGTSEGRLLIEMGCPVWHCSLTIDKNCLRIMLQDIYICNPEVCEMLGIISVTECKEKRLQGFAKKVHLKPWKQEGFFWRKKNKNRFVKPHIKEQQPFKVNFTRTEAYKRSNTCQCLLNQY